MYTFQETVRKRETEKQGRKNERRVRKREREPHNALLSATINLGTIEVQKEDTKYRRP